MNERHVAGLKWFKVVLWLALVVVCIKVLFAFGDAEPMNRLSQALILLPLVLLGFGTPAYLLGYFLAEGSPPRNSTKANVPTTALAVEARPSLPASDLHPVTLSMDSKHPVPDLAATLSISTASQSSTTQTEQLWAIALAEFEGTSRRPGVWARVFAEAQGNEALAKANYLKSRFDDMSKAEEERLKELHLATQRDEERKRQAEERAHGLLPKGTCPSCDVELPLASKSCPNCSALFGADSSWRIKPIKRS